MKCNQVFSLLAVAIIVSGCSARNSSRKASTVDVDTAVTEDGPTAVWKRQFDNAPTHDARAEAAAYLIRAGETDQRYWTFLASSAERSLRAEAIAASVWRDSLVVVTEPRQANVDLRRTATSPPRIDATRTVPAASSSNDIAGVINTSQTSTKDDSFRTSQPTLALTAERPLDTTNLAPLLYISIAGDQRGSKYLYQALVGENAMMAAQAALGLAKLHDRAAIDLIAHAAKRFPREKILFAQALAYFQDPEADRQISEIIADTELVAEIHLVARENGYDPYRHR